MSTATRKLSATAPTFLAIAAGLLTAQAIRAAAHHSPAWPWLAAFAAAAWIADGLVLYLPYRAEMRRLAQRRDALLRLRDEVPQIVREQVHREEQGQ